VPGVVLSVVAKVKLNISPESNVMLLVVVVPVGSVMLTKTVSTPILSVIFAVMLTVCVWLTTAGSAVTLITVGGVMSLTWNVIVSVLLMLLLVSFAIIKAV